MYLHVFTSNFLSAISNRFLFSSGHLQKTLPRKKKKTNSITRKWEEKDSVVGS